MTHPTDAYNLRKWNQSLISPRHLTGLTRLYQASAGLAADGYLGPLTLQSLDTELLADPDRGMPYGASEVGFYALQAAIADLGCGESEGNNLGPDIERYRDAVTSKRDGKPDSWCAYFVSWCLLEGSRRADQPTGFRLSGGAKRLCQRAIKAGARHITSPECGLPGDLIVWWREQRTKLSTPGKGHIGIVESMDGAIAHTIEGNKGRYPAKVRRIPHDLSDDPSWLGFVRI